MIKSTKEDLQMNVKKMIEEKLNKGLISAHYACLEKIKNIQVECDKMYMRYMHQYDAEISDPRDRIDTLKAEMYKNVDTIQVLMQNKEFDRAKIYSERNAKIPEYVEFYEKKEREISQKYQKLRSSLSLETAQKIGYWKDIDVKIQDRIDFNSAYMVDYLYAMYNLNLGHDGFYHLYKPYRDSSDISSLLHMTDSIEQTMSELFSWYISKEQADYIYDELVKWDILSPGLSIDAYEYNCKAQDPDPFMADANDACFRRMVEELILSGSNGISANKLG